MIPLKKPALAAAMLVAAAWLVISWVEAEKEIRILCAMFQPGQSVEEVLQVLATGAYLQYEMTGDRQNETMSVYSNFNLRRSRCRIDFQDNRVDSAAFSE